MIHQGSAGFRGAPSDIQIAAREVAATTRQMAEIIGRHAGRDVETVMEDIDRDRFMTPAEAVEYGLVDAILAPPGPRPRSSIEPCSRAASIISASPSPISTRRSRPTRRLFGGTLEHRESVPDQGVEAASVLVGASRIELLAPTRRGHAGRPVPREARRRASITSPTRSTTSVPRSPSSPRPVPS